MFSSLTSACVQKKKLKDRKEMLKYLRSGERYWFSDDWYGSEKRKNPA